MTTDIFVTLKHFECCRSDCGILFGITPDKEKRLRDSGNEFYCPNGHRQSFTKSTVSKQKDEIAQLRHYAECLEADVETQRELKNTARYTARTYKGNVTKLKNRVGKGVCPCCNRHFKNLERHMSGQHPDFIESK